VEILWLDEEGKRQSYGKIKPGDKYLQHTFTGHVWLVTDLQGKTIAVFEAEDQPASVVVDATQKPLDMPQRRRFRGGRSEGAASPDEQWFAFFKDHNIYLRDTESREEFALSDDGTADDEYSGGVFWSADSKKLAVLRTKKGDDRKVYYIESSPKDQLQPKLHSYDYLKPGDNIPLAKPQLFDIAARKRIAVADDLFPNPWSVTDVHWDPDSGRFMLLYNQRRRRAMPHVLLLLQQTIPSIPRRQRRNHLDVRTRRMEPPLSLRRQNRQRKKSNHKRRLGSAQRGKGR
jgi:hypothetical protein